MYALCSLPYYGNEREKKKKTAVTRETKCSNPRDRPSRLLSSEKAQVDGGKGVPATRRPNPDWV